MNFVRNLFDTSDFPARWNCGRWTDFHGWLHIGSDIGVWSAYFAIPVVLLCLTWRREDLPFRKVFFLFGSFILLCGTTHLMEAIIFWWPAYRLAGVLKLITAIVSWGTVFALLQVAPRALSMRSPEALEREIVARKAAEQELQRSNERLEHRVEERTAELATTNATLSSEREWFRTTLASIGDAVITTDTQGRVITLNREAERLTGWSLPEAQGQPLPSVFHIMSEENRQPVENPAVRALEEGMVVGLTNHTILTAKDGSEWFIDDSAAPIQDEAGNTTGAVLVFRDISEKYRAEREQRQLAARLESLVQNAPIGIALFDNDLRFVELNERAAAVNGLSAEKHLGKTPSELLPEIGPTIETHLAQVRESRAPVLNVELTGETPAAPGEERYWIANYYPVTDERGSLLGLGAVALEITDRKRADQALQYQYQLTKTITDNASTAIFMMDSESRCTFMNPAAEAVTGFTFEEAQNHILHDLIHHTRPDGTAFPLEECVIDRALPERYEVSNHEDTFVRKNGELFPVHCNARPIYDSEEPVGTVIEIMDLTQQKLTAERLRESDARLRFALEAAQIGDWDMNLATHTARTSLRHDRCFGYSTPVTEWNYEIFQQHIHPEDREAVHRKFMQASEQQGDWNFECRVVWPDQSVHWIEAHGCPYETPGGEPDRILGIVREITERKIAEEELRDFAAKLSEADRRKDEFLATLAHELRNPLAPIRTGLEVMKMAQDDPDTLAEVRDTMERQTQQLIALVDDLMDVSRITRGKLQLRKSQVELAEVIQSAVEAARPLINEAQHRFSVDLPSQPVMLEADPHRLAQIFSNLLANAAKYTPKGGDISLSAKQQGNEVAVSVKDRGIGIPADQLDDIFVMFGQIDHPMQDVTSGLGIGLTLVKSLVEMHGGKVEAHSEGPGQGSEFIVRLSVQEQSSTEAHSSTASTTARHVNPCRVLLVDDNKAAADLLGIAIRTLGHEVRSAHDGQEAIEVAADFLPDVILMDIGMPRMNGYEAAKQIRQQAWGENMLLVALTGWGQEQDRQKSKEAGFDFHLVKPAEPAELQKLLESVEKK